MYSNVSFASVSPVKRSSFVFLLAIALAGCGRVGSSSSPTTSPLAAAGPTASSAASAAPSVAAPTYVNTTYKFGLTLPAPYQKSVRAQTFTADGGQRPAIQDAFSARTDAEEAAIGNDGCHTACPLWNYAAYVWVHTGTGSQTLRQYYASTGGNVGEIIEDTTVDGRPAIRITNGQPYPMQFIIKDADRIFVVAYQLYPLSNGISVPAGASKEKLEQILASFRFTP